MSDVVLFIAVVAGPNWLPCQSADVSKLVTLIGTKDLLSHLRYGVRMEDNTPALRILLAEDEEAMRSYLARALENAGYEVVTVDRGTAAVPLLESEHFDLLLSDIVMPEMDGIELAQRCNEVSPRTKVMFITGFAAVTLKASREQPQAKVLSKPFHLRDLVLEVERVFEEQAVARG